MGHCRETAEFPIVNPFLKEFYRFLLIQKTERSESILHDSTRLSSSQAAVRYSILCGSLFSPVAGCQSGQFNQL
jgi:hypothetical protein